MGLTGTRSFVGFGFGAIQAGLFLYEAYRSGAFNRLTVAEVLPGVVAEVRAAGGVYALNIAHADRIEPVQVGPVAIENPGVAEDRERLITAVAAAGEIATAVPSVRYYAGPGPDSLHRILAEGLRRKAAEGGPRAVVYAAENTANAAAILADCVLAEIPAQEQDAVRAQVRFLDTVIAKMCGVHENAPDLAPITPGGGRAFLVEAFNRILISRIDFGADIPFQRGIAVFEEKADLAPFEEAKLYGHNAVHALAAYLAMLRGVEFMSQLRDQPGMMALMHAALEDESGAALLHKYGGLDPFFTPAGYAEFAQDLLARMVNPTYATRRNASARPGAQARLGRPADWRHAHVPGRRRHAATLCVGRARRCTPWAQRRTHPQLCAACGGAPSLTPPRNRPSWTWCRRDWRSCRAGKGMGNNSQNAGQNTISPEMTSDPTGHSVAAASLPPNAQRTAKMLPLHRRSGQTV